MKIKDKINEIETQKNHTKNQWNKKLVLWKNKQDWHILDKPDKNEERKDPN
jgi:hypothetical protein